MNFIGLIAAAAAGAAQPLMSLLFGNLTQDFVRFGTAIADPTTPVEEVNAARESFKRGAASNAASLTYLGLGMFAATFIYMYIWVYTAEVNAKRIREEYLKAVLRQDIAYFDNVGSGEVATRIETDTHLVQQGISEKVALVVNFIAAFFTGFILAYVRNWRLALALSTIIPVIGITGATMNKFISRYMQLSLKHVAEGGSLAEEVISTVRTAQAFGTQKILSAMYDIHIGKAFAVDFKAAMVHGFGLSVFFFVIYSAYALAFQFGTTLIIQGHATPGEVVNVFFAVLIGSFSLAMLAPEMQGKFSFQVHFR
jgi:ATP-binding cassette subfamily B (MDR/TAP) protein 1